MEKLYIAPVIPEKGEEQAALLPPSFLEGAQKYGREEDRARALCCRVLLKKHLQETGVDPYTLPLLKTAEGKPYLPVEGVHFSFAHSGDLAVLLVSDVPCGADVEEVHLSPNQERMMEKYFSSAELAQYESAADRALFFTTLWTKKEAEGKRRGTGIFPHSLKDLDVSGCESALLLYGGRRYCLSVSFEEGRTFNGSFNLADGVELLASF